MLHIADPSGFHEVALDRVAHDVLQEVDHLQQVGPRSEREVDRFGRGHRPRHRVGDDGRDRVDEGEVARLGAVAVNGDRLAGECRRDEGGYHRGVGVPGGLQRTEDVEEPEGEDGEVVGGLVGQGVGLRRQLRRGVGTHGPGDEVLRLRQRRVGAVDRRRRGDDDRGVAGRPRGLEHVDRSRGIGLMRCNGILDRPRNRGTRTEVDDGGRRRRSRSRRASTSRMSASTSRASIPSRFDRNPVERLSNARTSPIAGSSLRRRHRFAPMKPAPPVTTIFMGAPRGGPEVGPVVAAW